MKTRIGTTKLLRRIWMAADTVLFSRIAAALLSGLLPGRKSRLGAVLLFLAMIPAVICLRYAYERIRKRRTALRESEREKTESLLLMNDDEIGAIIKEPSFRLIRKQLPDEYDVLEMMRQGARKVGVLEDRMISKAFRARYASRVGILSRSDLLSVLFTENGTEKKENRGEGILAQLFVKRYFLLAGIFFCVSFILKLKIYYRLISSICMIIAVVTGVFGQTERWKNLRIFLDKKEDR